MVNLLTIPWELRQNEDFFFILPSPILSGGIGIAIVLQKMGNHLRDLYDKGIKRRHVSPMRTQMPRPCYFYIFLFIMGNEILFYLLLFHP